MQTLPSRDERRSAIDIIVRWWRTWSGTDSCLTEPRSRGAEKMVPMGEDLGLSAVDFRAAADLRALASHGPDEANLLPRRMAALRLDPDEIARLEPRVFRDLAWRCLLCESQGRCAWQLADDFAVPISQNWRDDWQNYCPNAEALSALGEMPWFRPASGSSPP